MCRAGVFVASKVICCVHAAQPYLPLENDVLDGAAHHARDRLIAHILNGCLDGHVGRIGFGQRQIRRYERVFHHHRPRSGEKNLLPDAGVAIANGIEPVPAKGRKKRGAIEGGDAAVLARHRCAGCVRAELRDAALA